MMIGRSFILLLCLLLWVGVDVQAQNMGGGNVQRQGTGLVSMSMVTGKVMDSTTKKPLNLVVVELVRVGDKPLVEGGLTDAAGDFKVVLKSGPGKYILRLTAVGYPVLEIADTILLSEVKPQFDGGVISPVVLVTAVLSTLIVTAVGIKDGLF